MFSFWRKNKNIEQLKNQDVNDSKSKADLTKDRITNNIAHKMGWSYEYTREEIENAKKRIGINYTDYEKYDFCNVPMKEQAGKYLSILRQKEKELLNKIAIIENSLQKENTEKVKESKVAKNAQQEMYIREVIEKTGWSRETVVSKLEDTKKRYGINYSNYVKYELYNIPVEQQEVKYTEIKQRIEKRKKDKEIRAAKKRAGFVEEVVKATGWDPVYAEEKMLRSEKMMGASFEHYAIYRFWELDEETQKEFFCKGDADLLKKRFNKNPEILKTFMNKDLFCEKFEPYLGRPWMSTNQMKYEEFVRKFGKEKKLIYKPRALSGGHGVEVFEYDETSLKSMFKTISALPPGVIEGYVIQHSEMQKLSLNSVNTIRVVTIQTDEEIPEVERNKVNFVYAGVRMGQGKSYVDNLHSGGMIAVINLETGVVETNAVNFANVVFEKHPDTGTTIKGFQIPYFKEVKQLIERAGNDIPGYLGWDIAITENGPIIIEINTHPGADGLQTPYVPEKKGVRYVVAKYLPAKEEDVRIPEVPYGPKISSITKEGIEFYWKKLEVADGYEILRAYTKEGPFEAIATITSRAIGTFIDSEFDHNKREVYYTLRSYIVKRDGSKVFSKTIDPTMASYREEMMPEREVTYMYSGSSRTIRVFYGWGEVVDAEWKSDNENVATISQDGIISAITTGECTLTCISKSMNCSTTSKVVVNRSADEPLVEISSRFSFNEKEKCWENPDAIDTGDAIVMMVGDMMCGKRQMQKQHTEESGWNFNESYEFVKEITASSDFAVGNLETLLASGWPYMLDETYIDNMNNCNATSRYLDAVKYGGFDAVVMANNHNCDGGKRALFETIEQVDKYKLAHTGVFCEKYDPRFLIVKINGIKVGFLSYISSSTGFNEKDINWNQEDKNIHLNIFDREKAVKDIADCKDAGAEFIVVYMHWGFKNFRKVVSHQYKEAQAVAAAGADYIVGSNPHLIQKYEVIITETGRKVPCAFSIGNFQAVMNQVRGNRDSVILRIRLCRNSTGEIELMENNYIPCHTYTTCMKKFLTPVSVGNKFNLKIKKKERKEIHDRIVGAIGDGIKEY